MIFIKKLNGNLEYEIRAPLFWWITILNYPIEVKSRSNSFPFVMTILEKEFEPDDFSLYSSINNPDLSCFDLYTLYANKKSIALCCEELNRLRGLYLVGLSKQNLNGDGICAIEPGNETILKEIFMSIPLSYNVSYVVSFKKDILRLICNERFGSTLDEWKSFIEFFKKENLI